MSERESFKRRVRARMEKTGERDTAARRHVADAKRPANAPETSDRPSADAVVQRTGKTWNEWFAILDEWGALDRSHRDIARHLREDHEVSGWWAQSVTVAYEKERGLRAKHERPGGFSIGASKTVAVPVERLYAAFVDEGERARLLPDAPVSLRTAQPNRSARFDWGDGATRVVVGFEAKGREKSAVAIEHERLPDAATAERTKSEWRNRLARLKEVLEA
jgi:Domain of unknown function (DUF4287)